MEEKTQGYLTVFRHGVNRACWNPGCFIRLWSRLSVACGSCDTGEYWGICHIWANSMSPVHTGDIVAELAFLILSTDLWSNIWQQGQLDLVWFYVIFIPAVRQFFMSTTGLVETVCTTHNLSEFQLLSFNTNSCAYLYWKKTWYIYKPNSHCLQNFWILLFKNVYYFVIC